MLLDWENQYCENDCTTQSNLQIQCNPYQITNGIFHRMSCILETGLWPWVENGLGGLPGDPGVSPGALSKAWVSTSVSNKSAT